MEQKKGYEVIRLIERGTFCHASLDYVEGITLYDWITSHKEIDKTLFYTWMKELVQQLVLYHRQRGAPDYGKLNPYHIVIMRKGKLALLADKEEETVHPLDRYFTPLDHMQNIDIYCFGKIIQFIMAHVLCEPHLSKIEEFKLQKIVRNCLETNPKRRYDDIRLVQEKFMGKKEFHISRKKIFLASAMLISLLVAWIIQKNVFGKNQQKVYEETVLTDSVSRQTLKTEDESGERIKEKEEHINKMMLQAGIDYFLENEDYEKSRKCLMEADSQDERTRLYMKLTEFMEGDQTNTDIQWMDEELEKIVWDQKAALDLMAILRVYEQIDLEKNQSMVSDIIEKLKENIMDFSEKLKIEFLEYQANMYEELKRWEEAASCYEKLVDMNEKRERNLQNYNKKSLEMKEKNIESMWLAPDQSDEQKFMEIQKSIVQKPELMQSESFKSFLEKQRIHIEEGKIWREPAELPQ